MGLSVTLVSEPMHVDISPALEMEAMRKISFPKRYRAIGPGGPLSFIFNCSGEVLSSETTKLPGSIWENRFLRTGANRGWCRYARSVADPDVKTTEELI